MEEDIHGNLAKYNRFISNIPKLVNKPNGNDKRRYFVKNRANLKYYKLMIKSFETYDNSAIRRLTLLGVLNMITYCINKDLAKATKEDINEVVKLNFQVNNYTSQKHFLKNLKHIWIERLELDPSVIKHTEKIKIDISKKTLRNEKASPDEMEQIINYFADEPKLQCFITLIKESYGRPAEALQTKKKNVEANDNYARIYVRKGKEGAKFLTCIDSFFYLTKWLKEHKSKDDNAFIFHKKNDVYAPLTPTAVNKRLREACKNLNIDKRITCYSLKRLGISYAMMRGEDPHDTQHKAGWSSLKQLKTYDLTTPEDSWRKQLAKKGLIDDPELKHLEPDTKQCVCGEIVPFREHICSNCTRLLDRNTLKKQLHKEQTFTEFLKDPGVSKVMQELFEKWSKEK